MKLDEYIRHLQDLQTKYAGLDIEIVQPHPSTRIEGSLCVVPAKAPEVWPVEIEASSLMFVPYGVRHLQTSAEPKGSAPDGVIVVFNLG